ncbi:MAG: alpha/beta fold hydrolase [Desulfobacterales bacterium]
MSTPTTARLPKEVRALYPFRSRWVTVNGFRCHYVDEGSGDPVLMVHGNPTWSFFFRKLIEGLSPCYRAIAPDHIGCGLSEKPHPQAYDFRLSSRINDLRQLIASLNLDRKLSLILHDWGGMIGMAYAVAYPENIGRIVIMNTAAFPPPTGKSIPLRLELVRRIRPFAAPAVLGLNIFARAALYMAAAKTLAAPVKKGLLAPYDSWHNRRAILKFVQDIPLSPKHPSYAVVKQTAESLHLLARIPILILWGKRDFVFDPDYLEAWQKRFPSASVHVFDDAGHYLLEDAPEEALNHIRRFLDQNPLDDTL